VAHALLPLKNLDRAKSRLSGLLRPTERRALAQAMAEDVLAALVGHPGIDDVTLVSDDPVARLLAAGYGVNWLSERTLGRRGLNPVVTAGVERLRAAGARRMLVLHGDLPMLTAEDVSVAIARQRAAGGLLIGTDLAGTGTNLLAFDATCVPLFAFGPDSCRRHRDWAVARGLAVEELTRPGIGADIDSADDLARLVHAVGLPRAGRTAELLKTLPLARIQAALASMDDVPKPTAPRTSRSIPDK
jgi:2-phospho-L-lactate guanylyltransferase